MSTKTIGLILGIGLLIHSGAQATSLEETQQSLKTALEQEAIKNLYALAENELTTFSQAKIGESILAKEKEEFESNDHLWLADGGNALAHQVTYSVHMDFSTYICKGEAEVILKELRNGWERVIELSEYGSAPQSYSPYVALSLDCNNKHNYQHSEFSYYGYNPNQPEKVVNTKGE